MAAQQMQLRNCQPGAECGSACVSRRDFLTIAGAAAAGTVIPWKVPVVAGPFEPSDTADHFVPADKKLQPEWIAQLFARGERTWYSGEDLDKIGMPVGGICAGQLYLAGDGRLFHWDIFNRHNFSGYGATNYQNMPQPDYPVEQGFAMSIEVDGQVLRRTLDRNGFPNVRFCGEYPIGFVDYHDPDFPVKVRLEAYSPFIPLNEEDSALPVTVLDFFLENPGPTPRTVTLAGWLQNAVACHTGSSFWGERRTDLRKLRRSFAVVHSARPLPPPTEPRPPKVLADFEGQDYGDWKVEGEAFGTGPAHGTLPNQQQVSGFQGKGLVNTYLGGDRPHGRLISPPFVIDRRYVSFLIGGGNHAGKTCMNLLVDGQIVRTATGNNNERLQWQNWDVQEFLGKTAQIEIVDAESGGWGHINVDQIELRDTPRPAPEGPLEKQYDFGEMALQIFLPDSDKDSPLGEILAATDWKGAMDVNQLWEHLKSVDEPNAPGQTALHEKLRGTLGYRVTIPPGQTVRVSLAVLWHFPNRPERGNYYAVRFPTLSDLLAYLEEHLPRLRRQTHLWHDTWYSATLPHWLLDRLFSTVANLATGTCQWWANGRFWAWEGVGCCHGTCAHVWNYEHALARLFPRLERSVREMQDFNPEAGFDEQSGAIRFRGEGWKMWAGDSQGGTILKAYREHQCSADDSFLRRNWPRIKKALEFLFAQDGDLNGLIEGEQHNTYDINFYGPNTMVGSLYLAACRAGEEMAKELGDEEFAARCRKVFEAGRDATMKELFNGEYFIQKVDLKQHPKHQYADGCLSDQLFGQGWAHQVGLGYIYPVEAVRSALKAIWVYNWAPDVGPQNAAHPPQRWFARPGQAGLFTCTWPKSKHLGPDSVLYRDEVWTGIEYQVAGHMVWEGMLLEALAICRGVHERYHPRSHNPWNEVECGDHYARALASYGVFLALCGFEYHGPKGHIGFAPRLNPDDFAAAFTGAEGWGKFTQKRQGGRQENTLAILCGRLRLQSIALEAPSDTPQRVAAVIQTPGGDSMVDIAAVEQTGRRVIIRTQQALTLEAGQTLQIELRS
ncbi:GH116 family glycosyl hydrolase [Thermogutta sp.]|uniref:GH116 family glycosyl hydrolase n=1 Tax=Thermogutta sp. TaxID=1962930 RepID=UPI0032206EB6